MQSNNSKMMKEVVRKVEGRLPQPILLLETHCSIKIRELLTGRLYHTPDVAAWKFQWQVSSVLQEIWFGFIWPNMIAES